MEGKEEEEEDGQDQRKEKGEGCLEREEEEVDGLDQRRERGEEYLEREEEDGDQMKEREGYTWRGEACREDQRTERRVSRVSLQRGEGALSCPRRSAGGFHTTK